MKKYLSILILFGILLVPAISKAQFSSTVSHQVVPVLKKSYSQAIKQGESSKPAAARSVLKVGMKGEDVRYLQAWLFNQGYNIGIDGSFGPQTKKALIDFQKKTQVLTADGVFGPKTALYVANAPTGIALKNLDNGVVQYLKQQQLTILSGKNNNKITTSSPTKNPATSVSTPKIVLAKLPKDVSSVLSKALPQAPKFTTVQVVSKTTNPKTVTKKPKAAIADLLAKANVKLVTASGVNTVAFNGFGSNYNQAIDEVSLYNICAEYQGDNTCVAVSLAIAEAIKAGQLDAAAVIAEILGSDDGGTCPFCTKDDDGNITITSGGGCGGGGGPGSGEFITPPGTPVGIDPEACIPASDILGKSYDLNVTSDNVFHAYWGLRDSSGNESLLSIGSDMNWDEATPNSNGTQPGWKSSEKYTGTAPTNAKNIYFAAAHDGWVTHGFLASLKVGEESYETGTPVFEVTKTTTPVPVHPADFNLSDVLNQIKSAVWAQTFAIGDHGVYPWGDIPGISSTAKWIFEGSDWDPEGKMANYEIYRLKICDEIVNPPVNVSGICMNYRNDEYGNPMNGGVTYRVVFAEPVVVTGVPNLLIKPSPASQPITAVFLGYDDAEHTSLKFRTEIEDGLEYYGSGTLSLVNGSNIKAVSGKDVSLSVGTFSLVQNCLPSGNHVKPISGYASYRLYTVSGTDVEYRAEYTIQFSEPVFITGQPRIRITNDTTGESKVVAPYNRGSGTNAIVFRAWDDPDITGTSWEVDYEGVGEIELNGGAITDLNSAVVDTTLPPQIIFDNLLLN